MPRRRKTKVEKTTNTAPGVQGAKTVPGLQGDKTSSETRAEEKAKVNPAIDEPVDKYYPKDVRIMMEDMAIQETYPIPPGFVRFRLPTWAKEGAYQRYSFEESIVWSWTDSFKWIQCRKTELTGKCAGWYREYVADYKREDEDFVAQQYEDARGVERVYRPECDKYRWDYSD